MKKSELLASVRNLQREVDSLMDIVIAMDDTEPQQPVKLQSDDGWMTAKQTYECLKISGSTFYEYIKQGLLPEGIAFGPRSKRWRMSDIRAWQKGRNHQDTVERFKTTARKRGRVSRIRKIEEFAYA